MFNRIRDRFGTAGLIVSIMALVLALAGGAFAASGGLNAKQKKQVKAIAKSLVPTGPVGPAGPAGPAGANGAKGDTGARGADGTVGTNGADGKTVRSGTTAPEGNVAGNAGDFYIRTTTNQIFGPKTGSGNTGWGSPTSLQGAPGNDGIDGSSVLSGSGPPDDGLDGVDGDFYINTDTDDIYGPKTAGAWGSPTSLVGSPWVVGQAPAGALMKGTWTVHANALAADELIPLPISTVVPVDQISQVFGIYVPVADQSNPSHPFGCIGSAADPEPAINGLACIYEAASTNLTPWSPFPPATPNGLGVGDGALRFSGGGNVFQVRSTCGDCVVDGYGTWAMKAPG